MSNISARLKSKRLECGLTKYCTAKVAGASNAKILKWKSKIGATKSTPFLVKIAKHRNIDQFLLAMGQGKANRIKFFQNISAETINLAHQIEQLPKQQRDFINRIVSVMHF